MSDCNELASLIAARPLGVLEPEDEARVAEHLALCPTCPALARRFEAALEDAVPEPKKAPDAVWARLHERIERDQAAPAKEEPRVLLACSFCHSTLLRREAVFCASCLAPHHGDCFAEHGRCSAPGCGETHTVRPQRREVAKPPRRQRVIVLALSLAVASGGGIAALALARREHRMISKPPGGKPVAPPQEPVKAPPREPAKVPLAEQDIPPPLRKALSDGAAALAARARSDGWTRHVGASSPEDTGSAVTALAARALAQLPPDLRAPHEPLVDRALALLMRRAERTGWVTDPDALGGPSYETYATAETLLALIARRGANAPGVTLLANGLAARQLCETTPFADVDFSELDWQWGGFAFEDRPILHRTDARVTVGGTAVALEALHAAGRGPEDAVMTRARAFVAHPRLQNFDENDALDGGFPESAITSKAGTLDVGDRRMNRSYGSATCDGLAALIYTGAPEARTNAAAEWVRRHFDPARMPSFGNAGGQSPFETGIRFYYVASLARALDALGDDRFGRPWAEPIFRALVSEQKRDGSWKNDEPVMNEDDEVIATSLALLALERIFPRLVRTEAPAPRATTALAFLADSPIESGFVLDPGTGLLLGVGREGAVYALDKGATRRKWGADDFIGGFGDTFSLPRIVGSRAYVGTTNGILTLDIENRTVAERYTTRGSVTGAPLYLAQPKLLVCGTTAGEVTAFAPPATKPVWRVDLGAPVRVPGVVLDDESEVGFVAEDERFHVILTDEGKEARDSILVGAVTGPPVWSGNQLYFANARGEVVKLGRVYGGHQVSWSAERWQAPGSRRISLLIPSDGSVGIVADDQGNVFGFDAAWMKTVWELRGAFDAGGEVPQLAAGRSSVIVLGKDGSGCIVNLAGRSSSRIKLAPGKLSVVGDMLVISDRNGNVRLFERP